LEPFAQPVRDYKGAERARDVVRWAVGLKRKFEAGDPQARPKVDRVMQGKNLTGGWTSWSDFVVKFRGYGYHVSENRGRD